MIARIPIAMPREIAPSNLREPCLRVDDNGVVSTHKGMHLHHFLAERFTLAEEDTVFSQIQDSYFARAFRPTGADAIRHP
jgi:hypothetical protein